MRLYRTSPPTSAARPCQSVARVVPAHRRRGHRSVRGGRHAHLRPQDRRGATRLRHPAHPPPLRAVAQGVRPVRPTRPPVRGSRPGDGALRAGCARHTAGGLGHWRHDRLLRHLLGSRPASAVVEAFVTSGSSLLTLGFLRPPGTGEIILTFVEAGIGLGLVSLMISYLPTIYGAFSRREALVGLLEVRAGLPPSPAELLTRYERIGWLDRIDDDVFEKWETVVHGGGGEPHQPAVARVLPFTAPASAAGSPQPAACWTPPPSSAPPSTVRTMPAPTSCCAPASSHCAESPTTSASPTTPTRRRMRRSRSAAVNSTCCASSCAPSGIPLKADRDQAWRDFAGWRVNYDAVLLALCGMVMAPPAKWSSDRVPAAAKAPTLFKKVMRRRRRELTEPSSRRQRSRRRSRPAPPRSGVA